MALLCHRLNIYGCSSTDRGQLRYVSVKVKVKVLAPRGTLDASGEGRQGTELRNLRPERQV